MLESDSPERMCLHEGRPVRRKPQKQDKKQDTVPAPPQRQGVGVGRGSAEVAGGSFGACVCRKTPQQLFVVPSVAAQPASSEWPSLEPTARPVEHDQVTPALCPHWTRCLPQSPSPPSISDRATSSQSDPGSVCQEARSSLAAGCANEGCGPPRLRQAE